MSIQSSNSSRVGFAGLGAMGFGMASNMLKAGFDVMAFDLNVHALERFRDLGGSTTLSIREASTGCSKFFVMVATPAQVDSLVFELEEGALWKTLVDGAILCLFSTLPPDYVTALKKRLTRIGRGDLKLLEGPVSGGAIGANEGQLSIMVAGDEDTLVALEAEFAAVSAPGRVFYCGELGAAGNVKMLNQHLAGIHIVATAEVLSLARACGLSPREAYHIIQSSEASSWIFGNRGKSMLEANWTPRSTVSIFTKDLGIVIEAADTVTYPCPLASVAYQAFLERAAKGGEGDDDASVVCNYEEMIGRKVSEELEDKAAPPTPPLEYLSGQKRISDVEIISNREISREKKSVCPTTFRTRSLSVGSQSHTHSVLLWDCSEARGRDNLLAVLKDLPKDSIVVAIDGMSGEEIQRIALTYPHILLTDGRLIQLRNGGTSKLLYSACDSALDHALKTALPDDIEPQPVNGDFGAAMLMHLVIRLGTLIHTAAAAECYGLASAKNVSTQLLYNLIAGAAGSSEQFNKQFPNMLNRDFEMPSHGGMGSFNTAIQDFKQIEGLCASLKFPARLLSAAHQIFKSVNRLGSTERASLATVVRFWDNANMTKT